MIVRSQMQGLGGELDDAWKNLRSNVASKLSGASSNLDRAELALKLAAYGSLAAALLAGLAAWGVWRRR